MRSAFQDDMTRGKSLLILAEKSEETECKGNKNGPGGNGKCQVSVIRHRVRLKVHYWGAAEKSERLREALKFFPAGIFHCLDACIMAQQ